MKTTLVFFVASAAMIQLIQGAPDFQDLQRLARRGLSLRDFEETMNHFTQRFLTEVWNDEGDNFVFSPFNLHSALAVLTSGATDGSETQRQLLDALGAVQNIERLEGRYKELFEHYLQPDVQEILKFGTRFWAAKNYDQKLEDDFRQKLRETYKAEILQLADRNAEKDINDWVNDLTNGKIDKIIDSVSNDAKFLIVTALYLDAAWTTKFRDIVEPQPFTLPNGEKTLVKMMVRNNSNQNTCARFTFRNQEYVTVSLPYQTPSERQKKPSQFEMVIIMPKSPRELHRLQSHLKRNQDNVEINIFDAAQEALLGRDAHKKTIVMPSFTIDSEVSVDKYFKRMGITAPFDQGGFLRILEGEPLKVSKINHRATVEVTKEGTVGAAATAIEFVRLFADLDEGTELTIDKPFLFYLRDTVEKTIIFAGKYANPNA